MLFVSQENCLIRNRTDNGSDQNLSTAPQRSLFAARRAGSYSIPRTLLHTRAVMRLARRRPSLALGLVIATGSAMTAAVVTASVAAHQIDRSASVQPLAPAPAPPAAPVAQTSRGHRFLAASLDRMNPLRGLASWYGDVWNGRKTASGETFDETKLTAAHKTLPLGTLVRVTNLTSHRTVIVKINDRGTLSPHRIIDLSSAAARELGMVEQGLAKVKLEIVGGS